jgi:serine/threonine protein kinase
VTKALGTLGPYELVAELGRGGMATLYLAQRVGPGGFARQVAVKVVHAEHQSDPHFVTMFLDEARLSARVQHPNVVHVEELGEHEGQHYLVMEYVDGVTLADVLRALGQQQKMLPVEVAVSIAAQAADGLHGAHESTDPHGRPLGLVHRDVSPSNILLSSRGHVKIIDFGIARAAGRLTHTEQGALKGKLAYMTPEQLLGQAVDRRSDIFALGIVLWEMLTMRRLFYGTNQAKVMARIRQAEVDPPSKYRPEITPALDEAVLMALARNRDERIQTAYAFRRAVLSAMPQAMFVEPSSIAELVRDAARESLEQRRHVVPEQIREVTMIAQDQPRAADLDEGETEAFVWVDVPSSEIPSLERKVGEASVTGDPIAEVRALGQLTSVLIYAGHHERASEVLARAEQIAEERAQGLRGFVATLRGQLAAAEGDLGARLKAQASAVELYEQAGWPRRAVRAAVNLADTYSHFGAYEQAERALVEALARARQFEMPDAEALALVHLGHAMAMQDRFVEADDQLSHAMAIASTRGEHRTAMVASLYRADLLCRAGRWVAARAEAERVAEQARQREYPTGEALALTHVARAAIASGDPETALSASERAYAIYKTLGSIEQGEGLLFVTRMRVLEAAGRLEEAKRIQAEGVHRLEDIALRIADPDWRRRFLRHVPSHAELLGDA